ncbi:MAG: cbb3-type cytochrome c oxidase subunit I [Anaerolineaceae bacterium]|nr:cbb3-type cytochrome c oxidase subunit I [Anaerolineaceae bacterium]
MAEQDVNQKLSPWWRRAVILVMLVGFGILIYLTVNAYVTAPPIPEQVLTEDGQVLFSGEDISSGQEVFLKYGLMNNGSIWGHGAYMGPDFSAAYLHNLSVDAAEHAAQGRYQKGLELLTDLERKQVEADVILMLKQNRYNESTHVLVFTPAEVRSFENQIAVWTDFFKNPEENAGLTANLISDPDELHDLTAFFAWASWVSVANRPDKPYSYTNNFPYDPSVGNTLTMDSILWSAISVAVLLLGLALVLFAFGRWDFLGWKNVKEAALIEYPPLAVQPATESQKGTIKYFVIVALLFLAQVGVGGLIAHYRADPGSFYGLDLTKLLPSNLVRTWHLQLAIFWIATSYIAGALFLAPIMSGKEAKKQSLLLNVLFGALVLVVVGSLVGEWLGIQNLTGKLWFWLGNQGWEYLELGRVWQYLLVVGLLFWLFLLVRALRGARQHPGRKEIVELFIFAAIGIPLFYVPAMFFDSTTNYTIVDTWRFWIIHLWVEGFFELFATVMVAIIFFVLGIVSKKTALRVIYLDAILYLAGGLVGTGHHWYWTGQTNLTIALAAVFSALEVVPLTLLTLDAWDFIKITRGEWEVVTKHKWTFYFLMAVGFWNFLGAGVFGFLINMPVISYFEVGTMLTPNHGHAAMMGVFGMLSLSLMVFALRQVLKDDAWKKVERFIKVGFWGLNIGLLLMVVLSLFPGGVLQLIDVINNGYWHGRSSAFMTTQVMRTIEWTRMVPDLIFAVLGVIPIVIAVVLTYFAVKAEKKRDANPAAN